MPGVLTAAGRGDATSCSLWDGPSGTGAQVSWLSKRKIHVFYSLKTITPPPLPRTTNIVCIFPLDHNADIYLLWGKFFSLITFLFSIVCLFFSFCFVFPIHLFFLSIFHILLSPPTWRIFRTQKKRSSSVHQHCFIWYLHKTFAFF